MLLPKLHLRMKKKPTSYKLQELFGLYQSGVLNKEEYEDLKSTILIPKTNVFDKKTSYRKTSVFLKKLTSKVLEYSTLMLDFLKSNISIKKVFNSILFSKLKWVLVIMVTSILITISVLYLTKDRSSPIEVTSTLWSFNADGYIDSNPILYEDVLYFTAKGRRLVAINTESGLEIWSWTFRDLPLKDPNVVNGVVYIGSLREGFLFAIDAKTGREIWRFLGDSSVYSRPEISNGLVVFGTDIGLLFALDVNTGREKWRFHGSSINSTPLIYEGKAFVGSKSSFYAIDIISGEKIWEIPAIGFLYGSGASPVAIDKNLYFGTYQGSLYCVAVDSGEIIWHYETEGRITSTPAIDNDYVYIGCDKNNLYAINRKNGRERWSFEAKNSILSSPVIHNNHVIIGSCDRNIYALNKKSGKLNWYFKTEDRITATPVISDEIAYITSMDGHVYAIDTKQY